MPRKYIPITSDFPYHVSARCINREWFELPLPTVWSIMEDYLYLVRLTFDVRIHSFVLMSNHFHLLITAPNANLSEAMRYFMRETSRELSRLTGRINQTYGGRHHKCLINSSHHFMNAYKYVYRNPVRAGASRWVEEYPFSTMSGLLGIHRLTIPLVPDALMDDSNLRWLNTASDPEHEDQMRKALRHGQIEFKPSRKTGKRGELSRILI